MNLDQIIKDIEYAAENEKVAEWKERILWLIEEAKEADMYRMAHEVMSELKEEGY